MTCEKIEIPEPSDAGRRLLEEAARCWTAWASFREERQRNKRYTYGRQWDDTVTVDGETMTEKDYIVRQGHIPLKNNLIRRLVRNVLGAWRDSRLTPKVTATAPEGEPLAGELDAMLRATARANALTDVMARSLEEFLISGFVVHRKWLGVREGQPGCWTDYVSPDMFFMDTATRDFRGWDLCLAGEIHDLPFHRLAAGLCADGDDCRRLAEIYRVESGGGASLSGMADRQFGVSDGCDSFLRPSREGLCRVFEIWRRESLPRYRCHDTLTGELFRIEAADHDRLVAKVNDLRRDEAERRGLSRADARLVEASWMLDDVWRFYHVSPDGRILRQGESPYSHRRHPYVFKAYPFIDGEIHSFVADVIDQQRYTNRLITLYDWVMRSSAKGVLLFPESCLPDGWELRDVADEWSRFNGVIMIRAGEGEPLPRQVSANAVNIGITELLDIQMKLLEDISGVNGALQGKIENGRVSGTLYDSQTRNAMTSLRDLLETFRAFEREGAEADVANLLRFHNMESGTLTFDIEY